MSLHNLQSGGRAQEGLEVGEWSWEKKICENSQQEQPGGTRNPLGCEAKAADPGVAQGFKSRLRRLHLGLKLKARQVKLDLSL